MWTADGPQGRESDKIAALVIPYTRGKGLDIGCGTSKCWPHMIGYDNLMDYGGQKPQAVDVVGDSSDLSLFADSSLDFVFSSHNLEHIKDYKATLKEWWRVIKAGGYLSLYLPHKDYYPNIGSPDANPDHKHDFLPEDIISAMKKIGSWELLENDNRNEGNEYSFFLVFRKVRGTGKHSFNVWQRHPNGLKRCLIIRYGAIGDQIMVSSILPRLKDQGYHITYNTTPEAQEILLHDPHVDEWLLQDKDQVPNLQLAPYWNTIAKCYDKVINLCESVEGALITLPGRLTHQYSAEARKRLFSTTNYLERTHDIADVPHEFSPKFYPTTAETEWANKLKSPPAIVWAINGSSPHKVYPFTQVVLSWLLEKTPAHIYLTADAGIGKELQDAIMTTLKENGADTSRLHGVAGEWKIRQALTFATQAECVVGPETGILNAVCMEDVPKVIYLSHSSHENLTKHWKNTTVLEPENTPCFPCNRLHYTWEHCNQVKETGAALCASSIKPERVFKVIMDALISQAEKLRAA